MKNDSQAEVVIRKIATLLHIKNAPNRAFFGCFEDFLSRNDLFSLIFYVFLSGSKRPISAIGIMTRERGKSI
jgi:hypothetical protein